MKVEKIVRPIINRMNVFRNDVFIHFLKNRGVGIGRGCYFFAPMKTTIDVQRPHMLHIGNYVKVTKGVVILCHDYSRSVFCNMKGYENCGEGGETFIGNNVFIGLGATILMGTHVGDNVIIGAGSVVSGFFPDNVVIAGNPAKVVCTIDDYYKRQKENMIDAAILYAQKWKQRNHVYPTVEEMTNAFSWIYLSHTNEAIEKYPNLFRLNGVDRELYIDNFLNSKPEFESYEAFLNYCDRN